MALVKDSNVENVINEATPGGIIKAEHIDTIAGKVLYQKNVQTGDSLPSASGYSEGDIFTVEGGSIYRHNGTTWIKLVEDSGVKVYRAFLTQSGTDAPVALVLEDTLGGNPTFGRSAVGQFSMSFDDPVLTENKTVVLFSHAGFYGYVMDDSNYSLGAERVDVDVIQLSSGNKGTDFADGIDKGFLEIIVYP